MDRIVPVINMNPVGPVFLLLSRVRIHRHMPHLEEVRGHVDAWTRVFDARGEVRCTPGDIDDIDGL